MSTLFPSPKEGAVHIIIGRASAGQSSKGKSRALPSFSFRELNDPVGLPSSPDLIRLYHPANGLPFFVLPAYDLSCKSPLQFGIHHDTLLTIGRILAYNKTGFLSTSRKRDAPRVEEDLDSILPVDKYYFHLDMPGTNPLYPICRDFSLWNFPHDQLPTSWTSLPSYPSTLPGFWNSSWDAQSLHIKDRDKLCRLSRWKDSLTAAHIIPKTEEVWLTRNNMDIYTGKHMPESYNSPNLFALRYDLCLGQFDRQAFVFVPKCGRLVVHFIQHSEESAHHFHNTIFDHENTLSHDLLYARFAWSLIKIVQTFLLDSAFRFENDESPGDGRPSGVAKDAGSSRGWKRKRREDDDGGEKDIVGGHHSDGGSSEIAKDGGGEGGKRKRSGDNCKEKDADGGDHADDLEARELAEDMKLAARTLTFFVDPNKTATPNRYETTVWYPGHAAVERRKQAYFKEHPQIRSHSDRLLPDSYDASDDEPL